MNAKEQGRNLMASLHAARMSIDQQIAKAKEAIGDQDHDGDVDLRDVQIKAGVTNRELVFGVCGIGLGYFIGRFIVPALVNLFGA